jgi:hypothetical protein
MISTQYPEINRLLDVLLAELQRILRNKLVGFYLYGSLVWGDFDIDISDVDLLAALTSDLTPDESNALKRMHDDIAARFPAWQNRIEVQYFSTHGLKTFKTQVSPMGNISPGEPFHIIKAGRDWLMNWYFVQDHGVTLYGPPPSTLIDSISVVEFVQRARDDAKEWRDRIKKIENATGQSYAILTLCRALYTIRHRRHVSKSRAIEWAKKQYPEWATLLQNALIWRKDPTYGGANLADTKRFVNFMIDQVMG